MRHVNQQRHGARNVSIESSSALPRAKRCVESSSAKEQWGSLLSPDKSTFWILLMRLHSPGIGPTNWLCLRSREKMRSISPHEGGKAPEHTIWYMAQWTAVTILGRHHSMTECSNCWLLCHYWLAMALILGHEMWMCAVFQCTAYTPQSAEQRRA